MKKSLNSNHTENICHSPLFKRASGILMPISALPGKFGIGTFGQSAKDFVDFLVKIGCTYWQVLPFGPIDDFNSPYQSLSAFAGNPFFIDPQKLKDDALLTDDELQTASYTETPWLVAYNFIRQTRMDLFKKAFARIDSSLKEKISRFEKSQPWLKDYALYTAIASKTHEPCWINWDPELRDRVPQALERANNDLKDEINFQVFLQYLFFTQWHEIKTYANDHHIKIIGDMPMYVALQSPDVWAHPECFDLDSKGAPKTVAGVPPDYFSEDGQLWGNPLYDWAALKKQDYKWWVDRLGMALTLFDTVRIDHFRAFSAYWSVPAKEKTARNGKWLPGPGTDLFKHWFQAFDFSTPRIIAEDLGVQDDGVRQLLKDSGFPGMRVLQFAFIDTGDGIHWPHNYIPNTVAYTGTHDNNTLLGYLWELNEGARKFAFEYCHYDCQGDEWQQGGPQSSSCRAFIRLLWMSCARLTIVPIQDALGYGADSRINVPGRAEGNWAFRLPQSAIDSIDTQWFFEMNRIYKRMNPYTEK